LLAFISVVSPAALSQETFSDVYKRYTIAQKNDDISLAVKYA
jgi:hypothetical protein